MPVPPERNVIVMVSSQDNLTRKNHKTIRQSTRKHPGTGMKAIKDPVHGYIQVDPDLLVLLDSPEVQRLRYIRQLGFSFLVYPGAHHTRFEHSLGAMHLAALMSRQIGLAREDHLLVMSAALLHDIGHGPFSHPI